MTVLGTWNLTISTPMGEQAAVLELAEHDGAVTGTATNGDEHVVLNDVTADGDHVTWKQNITKPMKLTMAFDLTAAGDSISGTAKPGMFPASKVTGTRAS